ncbi:hypothetical protein PVAP13_3NG178105 [Panicum virgatum]|uniref:Uncharacterized protein n=1 Tax=Panicum virgatum TaxID=38727 RepID=A0A8T0U7L7_PANVG|nr:hypothetical protein PVAP13_3NG178105 [Panicum virgatum]
MARGDTACAGAKRAGNMEELHGAARSYVFVAHTSSMGSRERVSRSSSDGAASPCPVWQGSAWNVKRKQVGCRRAEPSRAKPHTTQQRSGQTAPREETRRGEPSGHGTPPRPDSNAQARTASLPSPSFPPARSARQRHTLLRLPPRVPPPRHNPPAAFLSVPLNPLAPPQLPGLLWPKP